MAWRRMRILGGWAAAVAALAAAAAAEVPDGTAASLTAAERAGRGEVVIEGPVRPFRVFRGADVVTAGVGLRNQPEGRIVLDRRAAGVRQAYLYWTVIRTDFPGPPEESQIYIARVAPTRSALRMLTGTEIGLGPSPCWGGDRIIVFRAPVPRSVVNGPGIYDIVLPAGVPGRADWLDPWVDSPLPAYSGASLVVVTAGSDIVTLHDWGLAGRTFIAGDGLAYSLTLPPDLADSRRAMVFHQIHSSGQSRVANFVASPELSGEVTQVNGVAVGGPGSHRNEGDANGAAGGPVFQLWDNSVTDITRAKRQGARQMAVDIRQPGGLDCITPVAVAIRG